MENESRQALYKALVKLRDSTRSWSHRLRSGLDPTIVLHVSELRTLRVILKEISCLVPQADFRTYRSIVGRGWNWIFSVNEENPLVYVKRHEFFAWCAGIETYTMAVGIPGSEQKPGLD